MNQFKKKQSGVSLLELIVAMGVGLIILLALGQFYVTANRDNLLRSMSAESDETARQIYEQLQQQLSLSGYVDTFSTLAAKEVLAIQSNDNVKEMYARKQGAAEKGNTPLKLAYNAVNSGSPVSDLYPIIGSDDGKSVGVVYQVNANGSNAGLNDTQEESGWATDCEGNQGITTNGTDAFRKFAFSFDANAFKCGADDKVDEDNDKIATKTLVGGDKTSSTQIVEGGFRYLVTAVSEKDEIKESLAGMSVEAELSAKEVGDPSTSIQISPSKSVDNELVWSGVTGVRVCFVVASEPTTSSSRALREIRKLQGDNYDGCDPNEEGFIPSTPRVKPADDNRMYRRYIKTFSLPNALYFRG
ncbi:MAG: prepilin-type N-terminal cleavage/methylation domain-containing protein [Cardiobacteriaceae bacterium]|nr:prepilin-type N-terminal cleavage/methylation domain-containing protein [Cardiobacteriaceae bacterium]